MRFRTEIAEAELPSLIDRLLGITGVKPWMKRFAWLEQERRENPQMEEWLRDRCGIEWALGELASTRQLQTGGPDALRGFGRYELAAFAAGTVLLFESLSEGARRRLRGQLIDGLKSDSGLLAVQHEVSTVVHLVRAGFDVEPHDLEKGRGFDFLARREGAELEVECKLFSADIGRKIHRRQSARLFRELIEVLQPVFRTATSGLLIRVTLPDRLTPSPEQHAAVARVVQAAVLAGSFECPDACAVRVYDFEVAQSPFASKDVRAVQRADVEDLVARLTGRQNSTLMLMIAPAERVVIVQLESAKSDTVLAGIRRQLRDAADKQLSGTRPGCLVAQLHDLTDEQLVNLAALDSPVRQGAPSLQVMTSDLLQAQHRQHIHSVVYRARSQVTDAANEIAGQGSTYVIKNAWHPLARDRRYLAFSHTEQPPSRIVASN